MIRTASRQPFALWVTSLLAISACSFEHADAPDAPPPSLRSQALTVPTFTTVDSSVTGIGTFQSHNQRVVVTQQGIFLTYAQTVDDYANGMTWRLMRSVDGGGSFHELRSGVNFTRPPTIEAASDGTLYLVHTEERVLPGDSHPCPRAYFYRLSPTLSYQLEELNQLCWVGAQKFSMQLDETRGFIYYAAHAFTPTGTPLRFLKMTLNGTVVADYQLTGGETFAEPSYPNLLLSDGVLYLAWTTVKLGGDNNDYYSIHVARSSDAGGTWRSLSGVPLVPPFKGDHGGSATEVTTASERACTTWLSSYSVLRGKAHFAFRRAPNASEPTCTAATTMRYRRFDATSGVLEEDAVGFAPGGIPFSNLDGFFSASPRDGTLFFASSTADNRLAVVGTSDQGAHWSKESESSPLASSVYAASGQRLVTNESKVVGAYTHPTSPSSVRFFSAAVSPPVSTPTGARLASTISASSTAAGYPIAQANDNDLNTRWLANLTPTTANNAAWVRLDLGATKYVSRLRYSTATTPYPVSGPSDYLVQASVDGASWRDVATFAASSGWQAGNDIPVDGPARFLKLTTTKVNDGSGWALGFREIWAEGASYPASNPTNRQSATVAVSQSANGYPAQNANDGLDSTLWVANTTPTPANNIAWIRLDLGAVKRVTRLRWTTTQGPPYPSSGPADYVVETSIDGEVYAIAASRSNAAAVFSGDELVDRNVRYVRLRTTKVNDGSGWSLSFKEIWTE